MLSVRELFRLWVRFISEVRCMEGEKA
jgi:hypothetical protein